MAYYRPKTPTELAEQRVQLLDEPQLWEIQLAIALSDSRHINPFDTRDSLRDAKLWWIGADCCDLLAQAAPDMPPVTLDPDFVPDVHGFAFFERPLVGQDAIHPGIQVTIDAIQWQPEFIHGLPGLAITVWQHHDDPQIPPAPLGRSDWPYGFDTDHELPDTTPLAMASIIEDRRIVAALWQLTSQTEVFESSEERPYRAAAKRIIRQGHQPQPVRLVSLNRKERRQSSTTTSSTGTRTYTHRWAVKQYWRDWPGDPNRRKAVWVKPHIRGPKDKPVRLRDTVKFWTKP